MSFLWGAATSSHQIEGGNTASDWWTWEALGNIEGGVRSGAATDHWNRFREDLRLAAELGLTSYRFSIEWSRIEPEEGRWDLAALEWYRELVAECEKHKLLPMATLHHFTSPQWLAERGGFTWKDAPAKFAEYTRKVIRAFGPRVPLWCTINEPMVLLIGAYLGKFMPPAEVSPVRLALACHGLLKAHVQAYRALHREIDSREGPWRDFPLQVGIAQNCLDFLPDRAWHPMERILTQVFHRFYNRSWLDAVTGRGQPFGVPGLVPKAPLVEEARGKRTADFIGINYYTKAYVQWRPRDVTSSYSSTLPVGAAFARTHEPASDLGWAIHPTGFRKVIRFAAGYGLPLYITENGIADQADTRRPDYLLSHLIEVARARAEGVDLRGYYHWSLLDNFEWVKGFKPRFGLYRVNYDDFSRTLTGSGALYRDLIRAHREAGEVFPSERLIRPAGI